MYTWGYGDMSALGHGTDKDENIPKVSVQLACIYDMAYLMWCVTVYRKYRLQNVTGCAVFRWPLRRWLEEVNTLLSSPPASHYKL